MIETDKPIVDMLALRRDLYLVMSLLLADKEVAKVENAIDWTRDFYDNEVRRILLWVAAAARSLLDTPDDMNKRGGRKEGFGEKTCGEYWADFPKGKERPLEFRQACNSVIHAKMILNYKIPEDEVDQTAVQRYEDRITIKGTHRGKTTHAELDIVEFVQIANTLISSFEENDMPTNRDTFKYYFKKGNKIVHAGITYDLDRREAEHQQKHGWGKGHIKQVGFRTTRDAALAWEREQAKQGKPVRKEAG